MIIRVFRAVVHDGKQAEFERFFCDRAVPYVKAQNGLVSMQVGKPLESSPNEFSMIMVWENIEALINFAGNNWDKAVILDEERHLLKEVFVYHFEEVKLI